MGVKTWFHFSVGVNDVNEELGGSVGTHAVEWRADCDAEVAELVADGAGGGEVHLALFGIAFFLDFGSEFGDDGVLGGGVHLEQIIGTLGQRLGGMGAKSGDVAGGEGRAINGACIHSIEKGARGGGALDDGLESGLLRCGGEFGEERDEFLRVVVCIDGGDDGRLKFFGRLGIAQSLHSNIGGVTTDSDEGFGGIDAISDGCGSVGEGGGQLGREFGDDSGEIPAAFPA